MSGAAVTVDFVVPSPPICIDTEAVLAQKNHGFEFTDSTRSATISRVEILDADSIQITLSSAPTGDNPTLHYARTGVPKWDGAPIDEPRAVEGALAARGELAW